MRAIRLLCVVALGLGACSIKDATFTQGERDAGEGAIDAYDGPTDFVVSATSMTVTEGMTGQLMISLTSPPQGSLLATLAASDDTHLGITPPAVLFSPTDWSTPQAITITGKPDSDTTDESLELTLSSTAITAPMVVSVTVEDDDAVSLVMSPSNLEVGEGTTGTIAVRLSAMPLETITVDIASADTAVATVSQSNLVFTPANYAIDQMLIVTGIQDVNTVVNPTTINFTSTSPALPAATANVQVTDDDVLGISTSSSSLAINEGSTKTFTVQLTQQPPGNVTVDVASALTSVATVSPATLTFTTANWNVGQTVTATAPADDDVANNTTTISLTATGLATRNIATTVTDDDTQAIVTTPASAITVTEGMTGTIGVKLAFRPAADVTVTTSSLAPAAATVAPATLTFTPANYATAQNVTVTGVQDANATDNTATIRVEAAALGLTKDVAATIDDDDTLAIETNMATVAVTEGATATFQVRLTAQPTAATTVAIATGDSTSVTATTSLTFSTSNYNTYQTVTVTGVQDVDLVSESGVVLTLTASGAANKTVAVNVTDNDTQAIVAGSTMTTVTEGGTATVGISLAFQPASNVTVSVASGTPGAATVSPTMLTFNTSNYATPQNITIAGVEDADTVNASSTISLMSSGLPTVTIAVTVSDNDALNLDVTPASVTIGEAGTGTIMVRLTAQPAAAVTVNVTSSDTGAATVSAASVSFSTTDWASYKSITVTGVDDADAVNEAVTVTFASSGLTSRTSAVTVTDNDTQAIVVSATSVNVNEGGTATFQVKLGAQPGGTTTVNLSSNNAAASLSSTVLTFDAANWNTYQTITVSGIQDLNATSETVTISLTSAAITSASVTANVTDNDTQKVEVSLSSVSMTEGYSRTVSVTLAYQPAGNYVVTITPMNTAVATVSQTSLTFNASNYTQPQSVTITGAEDTNAVDNSTTISFTATDATSASVSVSVSDNDELGIDISNTSVTVTEQSSTTMTVKLTAEPPGDTTVTIMSTESTEASVSPTSVLFTTANWNTARTVTITGVNDSDTSDESTTVRFTAPGLLTRTVSVTVDDNDSGGGFCGDGLCSGLEDQCTCPQDCSLLPTFAPVQPQCCDGLCQPGDSQGPCCSQDCGWCDTTLVGGDDPFDLPVSRWRF
ncbi:MAG: hypothetical protein SFX73_25970 [Kofleriaceae bacterium]|nr:hypothetical protein [Kofleriaceae bacterium]